MPDKVFISGATGFLGTFVVETLVRETDAQIVVLVRAANEQAAKARLEALWWEHRPLIEALGTRIQAVAGDVTLSGLGLAEDLRRTLAGTVTHIIHAAADTRINQGKDQLQRVNVEGTERMLEFAREVQETHGLAKFSHVSTAYVAGLRTGFIEEDSLCDEGFGSIYEQSKYAAELLVRECRDEFPIAVFRPAQIVGDSETGEVATFNTVYYPLKLYLKNKIKVVPLRAAQKMNIVPVDYAAAVVARGTLAEHTTGKTFHITAPQDKQPTAGELIDEVRAWAQRELDIKLARPVFISCKPFATWGIRRNLRDQETPKKKSTMRNMLALAPYFYEDRTFDLRNTEELMGPYRLAWREFLPRLLAYSVRKGFLDRSGRTVFEQMQVRQKSSRFPIRYFDVSPQGVSETASAVVQKSTQQAADALRGLGVRPGDRVAIVGINSVNYFIADAAIGLVGAVSVPLYYTAPLEEIEDLVARSNAKVLFVGTEKILAQLKDTTLDVQLVSMMPDGRSSSDQPPASDAEVLSWEAFLARGEDGGGCNDANAAAYAAGSLTASEAAGNPAASGAGNPTVAEAVGNSAESAAAGNPAASYGDLATIRYTSGTTGQPKGVTFSQYQLKWMGETLPSLLDWKSRNGAIRYLSFLPMSHVVEGILVAYAPYYILSDVEIYYLNDFGSLNDALPKVRPTIFFSVPRFYEKAWEQLISTGIGKYYLKLKDGAWKNLVGALCRRGLLRKAGLDACKQLIVGSAPISPELLEAYRGLGIEIYNAYGLTEAPLITLSRYGKNELGSVGALLPETQARINDEGEILIKGPQVTTGYDGVAESVVDEDGYFKTGDFGHFSPQGHLVLDGRKKELIITSYGKNINPQKVETRLKSIPLVSEVLVVGDSLPYCSAVIWVESGRENLSAEEEALLDGSIARVNESLSHPEQVKKWVFLTEALSIQKRELTPNLKLRRDRIQENYQAVLAALYEEEENEFSCSVRGGGLR